jgi:hypothetical protein
MKAHEGEEEHVKKSEHMLLMVVEHENEKPGV